MSATMMLAVPEIVDIIAKETGIESTEIVRGREVMSGIVPHGTHLLRRRDGIVMLTVTETETGMGIAEIETETGSEIVTATGEGMIGDKPHDTIDTNI
jgi:hypothetical protein